MPAVVTSRIGLSIRLAGSMCCCRTFNTRRKGGHRWLSMRC